MDFQKQNLFQRFSEIFIESQQSFSKCDVELRTKCRTLSEKLNVLVAALETDPFSAQLDVISTLEEDTLHILRNVDELENRRTLIKESVGTLQDSTKTKVHRRK
tara:strand:+ start:576 stop:887 length:312 start_codon:yes stop_codon:yes gene_type:complete